MKQKTNRIMTFGITELLPLLSESSRNEVLRLAEEKHLERSASSGRGKAPGTGSDPAEA